ncbi:uncharacterized protein LOC133184839 [Saccostrea echinata]|uniref:uncharacterized protein LOC133184839 n=1 Tax=Saccostrea echinata TaxID=191078 RepID=UPI002A80FF9C|nr:uncharacterized protein LOC133184839 [Saccostrea echinata]
MDITIQIGSASAVLRSSQFFLDQLRNYFEHFIETTCLETLLELGPYTIKTEMILQIVERGIVPEHATFFKSNEKEDMKKYFVALKKNLVMAYIATITVSKGEITEKDGHSIDNIWRKVAENVKEIDETNQVEKLLSESEYVKHNVIRLQKKILKNKRNGGKHTRNFTLLKESRFVRFMRFFARHMRITK